MSVRVTLDTPIGAVDLIATSADHIKVRSGAHDDSNPAGVRVFGAQYYVSLSFDVPSGEFTHSYVTRNDGSMREATLSAKHSTQQMLAVVVSEWARTHPEALIEAQRDRLLVSRDRLRQEAVELERQAEANLLERNRLSALLDELPAAKED